MWNYSLRGRSVEIPSLIQPKTCRNFSTSRYNPGMLTAAIALFALVSTQVRIPDVPFLATPDDVVDRMLDMAKVGPGDVVYDLGCGDGRIVIAAARKFGARGVGVDINPVRIAEANENARKAGVENLVTFRVQDVMETDVSEATVVALYMLAEINVKLRPRLTIQLRPGARIVSHTFGIGDWEPEQVVTFKDKMGTMRTLYRWTADGKIRP